jgi:hypothetical protein
MLGARGTYLGLAQRETGALFALAATSRSARHVAPRWVALPANMGGPPDAPATACSYLDGTADHMHTICE